jgi:hypothetical protein
VTPGYVVRADYVPRAQVSPSSIKLARMCERAWGYRYIHGFKELEEPWSSFVGAGHLAQKPRDKDGVKAWNRLRRPALGKQVHSLLEDWYAQKPIDWGSEPGQILLSGLSYFPHPSTGRFRTEEKIPDSFVAEITDGKHDYEFNAYIDVNAPGYCLDAKTTSSFDWMPKVPELLEDTQGTIYPLYVMHKQRVGTINARWVYMLTEGPPKARAVDFRVEYAPAKKRALAIFDEGAVLVEKIKQRVDANKLDANTGACDMYHRKCIYHHSVGGPCTAESSPGKTFRATLARGINQEKTIMAFSDFKKKLAVAQGQEPAVDAGDPSTGAVDAVSTEGAVETPAESAASEAKRTYTKRATKGATAAPVGGITVTFSDGFELALPAASPIATKLAAIHAAMFGE